MSWWQNPYPTGTPVPVPGFPRPLYPPDAEKQGVTPSPDGPDVQAYKRTISRAGRWPWQTFDDTYSDAFSHGKPGGNVASTGVAGIQRQLGIQDTGWVGKATFEKLRAIRIPAGLPHAGQPAMDATAQNLIGHAYAIAHPPAATRDRALDSAITWIGYTEAPAGSNLTLFGQWYGYDGQPWCAMFASYCYAVEAGGSPSFKAGSRYAYVPYILDDARAGINGLTLASKPAAGDLVLYDWNGGVPDHVGLFEKWTGPTTFTAVEGNTSTTNDSNGGAVMRRDRDAATAVVYFVRVA